MKAHINHRYNTGVIRDEVFVFLMSGFETTSTTISWGYKLLSDHQYVQKGEVKFDARAGPFMGFGVGPRGCFGEFGPLQSPSPSSTKEMSRC